MSIVSCMIGALPNALENALKNVIGADKAEEFVEVLLPILKKDKWSIFHPINDLKQLKSALEDAAKQIGIGWSTIADVAFSTAKGVAEKCFGLDAMDSYFEMLKANPDAAKELEDTVIQAIITTAKKQGHTITAKDLENNAIAKGYANTPSVDCVHSLWTTICSS